MSAVSAIPSERTIRYIREAGGVPSQVLTASRSRSICGIRHGVMRRLHADGFSAKKIGVWMGRDHTSVLYAVGRLGRHHG